MEEMTASDARSCTRCGALEARVAALEQENERLRLELLTARRPVDPAASTASVETAESTEFSPLTRSEMQRYSRQMLVPDFRVSAQLQLRESKVLVIGAGGLGCPVALYLGGMGVGCLGIVDDDRVERSNLHRQIGHDESTRGLLKVDSLVRRVRLLNPEITVNTYATRFTTINAASLVEGYDAVVDASDNPSTRYLINRVCAAAGKPLVSGSALGLEGQVTVFTYTQDAPCYQCLYPSAPAQPQSCEENGVLGVVPGIIGCIQALETVKVLTGVGKSPTDTQLLFDAYDSQFRRVRVAGRRRENCPACSLPSSSSMDLAVVCSTGYEEAASLRQDNRLTVHQFAMLRVQEPDSYVLVDTRPTHQFEMVHFPEAENLPFNELRRARSKGTIATVVHTQVKLPLSNKKLLVICRRGVDSVQVALWLLECGFEDVFNIEGGYTAYAKEIDLLFPMY